MQWAHLGEAGLVLASESGWRRLSGSIGPIVPAGPMPAGHPCSRAALAQLLDGAITIAERVAWPAEGIADDGELTPEAWAWRLVGQWYCAHHSVALLPGLITRCQRLGRHDLATFAATKLEEERGHDQFSLDDLTALGYDAQAAVAEITPPPAVVAAVEYARECARGENPVTFLGYVYALERRALDIGPEWFEAIAEVLPAGVDAVSNFRRHASELDPAHVESALDFIAGLTAAERTAIAQSCFATTLILARPQPFTLAPELAERLAGARISRVPHPATTGADP